MLDAIAIRQVPFGKRIPIPEDQARCYLRRFSFIDSLGFPLWATHYRASLSDGSSLHLVRLGNQWTIHRDRIDPTRDPGSALAHMVAEAPVETLFNVGTLYFGLKALGTVLEPASK